MWNVPIVDELRAMGCKVTWTSMSEGLRFNLQGTADNSPDFRRQVAQVFIRHGYREVREGWWAPANATEEQIQRNEQEVREENEHRRQQEDIAAVEAEHPDWSDEQIAEELSLDVQEVTDFRR